MEERGKREVEGVHTYRTGEYFHFILISHRTQLLYGTRNAPWWYNPLLLLAKHVATFDHLMFYDDLWRTPKRCLRVLTSST